jgi:hypothetical protein
MTTVETTNTASAGVKIAAGSERASVSNTSAGVATKNATRARTVPPFSPSRLIRART